jgi:hypothetical protein
MAKLIVGFVFAVVCVVIVIMLIRAVIDELSKRKKNTAYSDKVIPFRNTKDIFISIKDGIFFLKSIKDDPVYAPLTSEIKTLTGKLEDIFSIIEKNPAYINSLRDLEEYVIPLMKKFFCEYETYTQAGKESASAVRGTDAIVKGLNSIVLIFNRSVDALMENLTLDLGSEVVALREMYETREN